MGWKIFDFKCLECDYVFEDMIDEANDVLVGECPACDSSHIEKQMPAPALATFSMSDPETQKQKMLKRSTDHTKKEIRKEAEKFGEEGIKRARKGAIQAGYGGKGK